MSDYSSPPPPPPGGGYGAPPPPPGGGYGAPPPMPPAGGYGTPAPNNNLVIAILGLLCCWPLGIPAVVFAAQVNGKWASGDQAGAIDAAAKAKKFAIIALALGIIATVLYLLLVIVGAIGSASSGY